jgi:hypothetical protein
MADVVKYLVTVDAATGATLKVEKVGESGELSDVTPAPVPGAAGGAAHAVVFNIFVGAGGVTMAPQPAPTLLAGVPAPGTSVPAPGTGVPGKPKQPERPKQPSEPKKEPEKPKKKS